MMEEMVNAIFQEAGLSMNDDKNTIHGLMLGLAAIAEASHDADAVRVAVTAIVESPGGAEFLREHPLAATL